MVNNSNNNPSNNNDVVMVKSKINFNIGTRYLEEINRNMCDIEIREDDTQINTLNIQIIGGCDSEMSKTINSQLGKILEEDFDFDVFALETASHNNALYTLMSFFFKYYSVSDNLKINKEKLTNLVYNIQYK